MHSRLLVAINRLRSFLAAVMRSELFWIAIIALATLTPMDGRTTIWLCLICGERGTTDVLANILLFLPLGLALARRPPGRARYHIPIIVSFVVETLQIAVNGRNPALGDLVFNSLGGFLGIWLGSRSRLWWSRSPRIARGWLVVTATGGGLLLALMAFLAAPAPTKDVYLVLWTPKLGPLEQYAGRLTTLRLGGESLSEGQPVNAAQIRRMIEQDAPLHLTGIAGPSPGSFAPLFRLADDKLHQMLMVAIDGDDVVYRYRSRAAAWRLDAADLRASGLAAHLTPGGPLLLDVRPLEKGLLFELNGRKQMVAAPNLGMGWHLLAGSERLPTWLRGLLDYGWLILLTAPAAYWSRSTATLVMTGALFLILLIVLPMFSWLAPTPWLQLAAAMLGTGIGALAARVLPPPLRTDLNLPN